MPPVLNIIALSTFAASLSARALDPVLPHVASDFNVSIAAAAGFASVFAFTFAIIHRCWAPRRICSARRAS
jgi:predicted MFS family arabinose efflux permease